MPSTRTPSVSGWFALSTQHAIMGILSRMGETVDADAPWSWRTAMGTLDRASNAAFPLNLTAFLLWPLMSLTLFPLAAGHAFIRGDRDTAGDAVGMMFAPLIAVGVVVIAVIAIVTWTPLDEFVEAFIYSVFGWCWDIADGPLGPPLCAQ